jgi:MFS family permease
MYHIFRTMNKDVLAIGAAAAVRAAAVSCVGVTLAIHLSRLGLAAAEIGWLIGIGVAGSATGTVLVSVWGDRWGRRRTLAVLALLTAVGYAALAGVSALPALAAFGFVGMLNGMGRDRGPAAALEQAVLADTVSDHERTSALAWYNVILDAGHAGGALAAAIPSVVAGAASMPIERAQRLTFLICAAAMIASVVPYVLLSPRVEMRPAASGMPPVPGDPRSRRVITRLALLFGLDSIGGGFLNPALIAYWFFQRHAMPETIIALLFFAARILNAVSHLAAAWLARRIGLLNTMVWTHLPSSVLLLLVPASPGAALAAALFLAREALVEMDVPTRQSYVLAVVRPPERTFASGVTNVTRNVAWAIGPSLAGTVMQHISPAGPLVIGGALKIGYDLLLYRAFRRVRPPEER